jgi:hypothetical protein
VPRQNSKPESVRRSNADCSSASFPPRDGLDQFVGKFSAEHRADLGDLLARRPEPIEARGQRGIEGRGDGKRRRRRSRQQSGRCPVRAASGFEHRLGQLLDKERHAIGALEHLVCDLARQCCVAGDRPDERQTVALIEAVERQQGHVRPPEPRRLELGPEGDDQQRR